MLPGGAAGVPAHPPALLGCAQMALAPAVRAAPAAPARPRSPKRFPQGPHAYPVPGRLPRAGGRALWAGSKPGRSTTPPLSGNVRLGHWLAGIARNAASEGIRDPLEIRTHLSLKGSRSSLRGANAPLPTLEPSPIPPREIRYPLSYTLTYTKNSHSHTRTQTCTRSQNASRDTRTPGHIYPSYPSPSSLRQTLAQPHVSYQRRHARGRALIGSPVGTLTCPPLP